MQDYLQQQQKEKFNLNKIKKRSKTTLGETHTAVDNLHLVANELDYDDKER